MSHFEKVKTLIMELGHDITAENAQEALIVVNDEDKGLVNLLVDCEGDVLVLEQHIFDLDAQQSGSYKRLLQINRSLVHGAFVLDDEGKRVIFRDTLELPNLDQNELQSSLNALALALAEYTGEFLNMAAKS